MPMPIHFLGGPRAQETNRCDSGADYIMEDTTQTNSNAENFVYKFHETNVDRRRGATSPERAVFIHRHLAHDRVTFIQGGALHAYT